MFNLSYEYELSKDIIIRNDTDIETGRLEDVLGYLCIHQKLFNNFNYLNIRYKKEFIDVSTK